MSQQELQFYEGAVFPKPKIQCFQHSSEATHGCMIQECQLPFYCGLCTQHQHEQQDPYAQLKNIDQYIFEMSQQIKNIQQPIKSIYNQIQHNEDYLNLIKWQVDLDPHFKNVENYINTQKQLIDSDVIQISNKVYDILDAQKLQIFKKLDDFLLNYKIQFTDFKQYHDHLFQLIKKKFKYLGDSNSLSAKLNSLDAKLSQELIIELKESISQSENLLKNSSLNIVDIEKIFKEMNTQTTKLPNYKQLVDFEVIPSIQGQSAIKVLDQIKVQIEGHFKEACVNLFLPPQKLSIPQNQMPNKKTINFLQSHGRNSHGSVCSETSQVSSSKYTHPPNIPQLTHHHSYSQPHVSNYTMNSNSNSNQNNTSNQNPSFFNQGLQQYQSANDGLGQSRSSKPKIFSKQNITRTVNSLNSPINLNTQNQNFSIQNNNTSFTQNFHHAQSTGNLQRQNIYGQVQQFQTQIPNNHQYNQAIQQQSSGTILNSKYLRLKKEFQIPSIPKYMCYLTNGFIAMAVQGECLRILDINTNTIINGRNSINREIKFLASLQPANEGLISCDQSNILNFALSNIDSEILLFQFNTKTKEIAQKSCSILGFSSPVTRIVDLYPITNKHLLAAGDENGEVSVFDYDNTIGYGLEKYHSSSITQLLVISNNSINYTSLQSQLNYQPSKFISFSSEDQVLVIYSLINDKFQKQFIYNISNYGILQLNNHPEFEYFIAVCKNFSIRTLKFEKDNNIIDQVIEQRAKDIAIFSVKESLSGNSEYIPQQDPNLSGLIFTSEQESDKVGLLKATYTSSIIQKDQIFQSVHSRRKILYVDNRNRLFIIINDYNNFIQVYDIKP